MNIELFKTIFWKKHPTILFIIFSVISFGIYYWFWVVSRKKSLNLITGTKLNDSVVKIYIISDIVVIIYIIFTDFNWNILTVLLYLVPIILEIYISISIKNILKEFSEKNEMYISYNEFLTWGLTFIYINYKINENIDYIAAHSMVEKKGTTSPSPKSEDVKDRMKLMNEQFMKKS